VTQHGRVPAKDMKNISEFMLASRLEAIKNPDQYMALADYDEHNLLPQSGLNMSDIKSLEDIFNDDDLGLLDDGKDGDIFKIKHVPVQRAAADEVAKRKRCKDFDQFEHLFKDVHRELREGKRKLLPFNDKGYQLVEGSYYVLNGY
jgi:hypothetical protein